jgi:hypothetical protein
MSVPNTVATTLGTTVFSRCNADGQFLFRINSGVPIEEAMEVASELQFVASRLSFDAAMSDDHERFSWAAYYLGMMAKALMDDAMGGLSLVRESQ